jgi:uncharacterized membrane protein
VALGRDPAYHPAELHNGAGTPPMSTHLFIVHFPVSLILAGVLIDLTGAAVSDAGTRLWAGRLLIAGGFLAFLAFSTGESAKFTAMASQELDLGLLTRHEEWGSLGAWALLIIAFLRGIWRNRFTGVHSWLNGGLGVLAAGVVIAITISGNLVRHGT